MPRWPIVIIGFLFGGLVSSFLRLYYWRRRRGMSVAFPASQCPACGTELEFWERLPVVSWCLLGGKCRTCQSRIPTSELIIELVGAVLGAVLAWLWIR